MCLSFVARYFSVKIRCRKTCLAVYQASLLKYVARDDLHDYINFLCAYLPVPKQSFSHDDVLMWCLLDADTLLQIRLHVGQTLLHNQWQSISLLHYLTFSFERRENHL